MNNGFSIYGLVMEWCGAVGWVCYVVVVALELLGVVLIGVCELVENLLCTSISFRFRCLLYKRNGGRRKSCVRVGSFSMICQYCWRMCEIGGRSVL